MPTLSAPPMVETLIPDAHGYEISPRALERARAYGHRAHCHEITAIGPAARPQLTDGPSIVSVLRLLLNAPAPVRERALAFAAEAFRPGVTRLDDALCRMRVLDRYAVDVLYVARRTRAH